MPNPPNATVRRFATVQALSWAIKIAAIAALFVFVVVYLGGM